MAGPKAQTPPPIDRPLSKAYLRKFTGWSTSAPPGLSDPASLRVVHNCNVDTDGSLRIRPGLQHAFSTPAAGNLIGSFEHFYTADAKPRKAILYAVRLPDKTVAFRTAVYNETTGVFDHDPDIATRFPGATDAALKFNEDCTYVRYVQIDNKILALSNNTQMFRLFWVGAERKAKRITTITVPTYAASDALTVVHPQAAWVAGFPVRTNLFTNPRSKFTTGWTPRNSWTLGQSDTAAGLPNGIKSYVWAQCVTAGAVTHAGLNYGNPAVTNPVAGEGVSVKEQTTYMFSAWVFCAKAGTFAASVRFGNASNTWVAAATDSTGVALAAGTWTRVNFRVDTPAAATTVHIAWRFPASITFAAGDKIGVSMLLVEEISTLGSYFDGSSSYGVPNVTARWTGAVDASTSVLLDPATTQNSIPTPETPTTDTLISSDPSKNVYNFGYFYSFNNEIGETMVSRITVVKTQRKWTGWRANAVDDKSSYDQLVASIPQATYDAAVAQGALSWNLYYCTWSDQDSVPIEGVLLKVTSMVNTTYTASGWASHTPLLQAQNETHMLPSSTITDNFTEASAAGQGLVAGDRLVLVYDMLNAARIKWSSNQQGDYLNFSASKGGGFKTLTSGNLYTPACVKLWQNPQSVDTITALCKGLDGQGTAYYMNPNTSITTQTQATNVMGFEETTATPGTVSPYGCEVMNNALYHPIENNLMKSTASNYNINHITVADPIQNVWHAVSLKDKERMVSSQMSPYLYYLVHSDPSWNRDKWAPAHPNDVGNQVWVCDTNQKNIWSCWDVSGASLHKLELNGLLYMGISSGDNLYVFNPEYDHDDVWDGTQWTEQGIAWQAITNTQGANRAHDMWSLVQQMNISFGNFTGECIYGLRGKDVNGQWVEVKKHYVSPETTHEAQYRFDQNDFLQVRRVMMEWEFFWESAPRPKNRSYGSISFVQYRLAPSTVNSGYELGSVETFEYGAGSSETINGIPTPYADNRIP